MDFGMTGKLGGYYLAEQYRKNAAGKNAGASLAELAAAGKGEGVSFAQLAAAKAANVTKAAGQPEVSGMSFQEMWQTRFPGAYYHTMDASNIPQGVWERNDFPFEKFFRNDLEEAAVNWKPNGANPAMDSSGVQSRLHSIAGQKSIVVPPALEEKMKNDPALAQRIMAKIETFIATDEAMTPDRICSHLIVLDENGEIARFRASSHGGNITGPTEEEIRQFEAEQAAKKKRREEYARLNKEAALKHRLTEQEADRRYYQTSITQKAVSTLAYEKNIMEAAGILR